MTTQYGKFERHIGRLLDSNPLIRSVAKATYLRANYFLHREAGFQFVLHDQVSLKDSSEFFCQAKKSNSPVHEFFGYYDKSPWSPDLKKLIVHRWDGSLDISVVVYDANGQESCIGHTGAWNFQQGAMTQWLPTNSPGKLVFNSVANQCLVSVWVDAQGNTNEIPWPIQVVNPKGHKGLTLNYRRLAKLRPDYGYNSSVKNFSENQSLEKDGIWEIDLLRGEGILIISLSELANNKPRPEMINAEHRVNHILYSPSGNRFVFLHRWLSKTGKFSRLYLIDSFKQASPKLLLDDRMISHYSWEDEDHLLVWARHHSAGDRYYRLNVNDGSCDVVGKDILDIFGDGHPSFSPDRRWVITDTYPDRRRQRHLLLFDRQTDSVTSIGRFLAPWHFDGERRTDLHPRWSPDGKKISIDSAHTGIRRNYILDISKLVNS